MDELIFARHGESACAAAGRLNGDPSIGCPLTPTGVLQAHRLGELLAEVEVELWVATQFDRTRQTLAAARGMRGGAHEVVAELNDPRYGRYEGATLAEYRGWSLGAPSDEPAPGGGESRAAVVERYVRGLELLCARPERCVVVVAHSLPIAYTLDAAQGSPPRARAELVNYATPHRVDAAALERALVVLSGWLAQPDW